ncbi:spermidine synthase [Pelagibius sp. Alg239-R121]|uniref:spermidine synthase n=1 Tax=Pelagibius sp. Alg239-R121 TaxID=2993448 RepID=UPI0024A74CA3|nr:fused MFS/spermidine synthase [Pelagibius sp. Alg239-R121]
MASYQTAQHSGASLSGRAQTGALPLFAGSLFLSALLLFSVQPMFAKMVLPSLGGAPGVWNTSMVFFQTVLLAGYAYAHFSVKLLGERRQAYLHLFVLASAFVVLPIGLPFDARPWPGQPELWLLWTLTQSVGLPFLAVAATAPLLQKWFSTTGHPHAQDPYFLYGASNIGSLIALLGYPFLIEPVLTLGEQSRGWMFAYGFLALLIFVCLRVARRTVDEPVCAEFEANPDVAGADSESPDWSARLKWIVLALVPSSLLLGVTTHISTDVAAVPLLWVIPLALYLLTFVIVFSRRPLLRHGWMLRLQPIVLVPLLASFIWPFGVWIAAPVHLIAFFVTAMVCHGELARRRPAVDHLTEFYLWMSFGGMVGGFFAALVAPVIFESVVEYPLMVVLACLLRPFGKTKDGNTPLARSKLVLDVVLPLIIFAALAVPLLALKTDFSELGLIGVFVVFQLIALSIYGFSARPIRLSLGFSAVLLAMAVTDRSERVIAQDRSFFGISRITQTADGRFNLLTHGTTLHGAQHSDPEKWRDPLTYYHRAGPIGQLFEALDTTGQNPLRIGAVGLGAGTLACYRRPGQDWTFFEIDPTMERIARDPEHFRYLSACAARSPVVIGDARISLQSEEDGKYDVLVFDAFSSDAIPMHLLNREALALYQAKLAVGGVMAFHISNRTLDLLPIVARLAEDAGLAGRFQNFVLPGEGYLNDYKVGSKWVVLAHRDADLMFLETAFSEDLAGHDLQPGWRNLEDQPKGRLWTDDFSDILGALRW